MPDATYSKFGFDNDFFELKVGGFSTPGARNEALDQARTEGYAAGLQEGQTKSATEVADLTQRVAKLTAQLTGHKNNGKTARCGNCSRFGTAASAVAGASGAAIPSRCWNSISKPTAADSHR